jgi:hypothetical protein
VLHAGRASREAEQAAERAGVLMVEDDEPFWQDDPPPVPGTRRPRTHRTRY